MKSAIISEHGSFLFQELKLKDEECEKLLKVRDQMGEELEDLTASLFEVFMSNVEYKKRSLQTV